MPANKDDIVSRVQKLLNTSGRTPEEAAAFQAAANRLMLEYNLSLAELDQYKPSTGEYVGIEAMTAQPVWQHKLVEVLAKYNPVKQMTLNDRVILFGLEHNVEIVLFMATYLSREFERTSRIEYEMYRDGRSWYDDGYNKPRSASVFLRNWHDGARHTLSDRLSKMKKEVTDNANPMALVFVNKQEEELLRQWCDLIGQEYKSPEQRASEEAKNKQWWEDYRKEQDKQRAKYDEWFNNLSDKDKKAELKKKAKERKSLSRGYGRGGRSQVYVREAYAAGREAASRISLSEAVESGNLPKGALR